MTGTSALHQTAPVVDLLTQLRSGLDTVRVADVTLRVERMGFFGPLRTLGVALSPTETSPADYLNDTLLAPEAREATYAVVDAFGLLVCLDVHSGHVSYRDVRGRSSRGRLSQGEYFHHDGCSGPTKPRVVEIRCPHQPTPREVSTGVAPFEAVVEAMLRVAGRTVELESPLAEHLAALEAGGVEPGLLDTVQGLVTRVIRKSLPAEAARAFFREVDAVCGAFTDPWQMGESRLISNSHPSSGARGTMQHRRAHQRPHTGGVPNGKLVKRWPAEELF